jgi:C4-dicarboxylate transporter DctQ subunit
MRITSHYLKINSKVEIVEKYFAVAIITAIVIIVFSGTIARYFFKDPLFGADRLATYLMVWLGFIGFQIATSKLRHIEIEFLKSRVSPGVKYIMSLITALFAAVFLFISTVLAYQYMELSREMGDKDVVLDIPIWWIILIIPLSFFISALRYTFTIMLWYDVFKGRRNEDDIVKKQLL